MTFEVSVSGLYQYHIILNYQSTHVPPLGTASRAPETLIEEEVREQPQKQRVAAKPGGEKPVGKITQHHYRALHHVSHHQHTSMINDKKYWQN